MDKIKEEQVETPPSSPTKLQRAVSRIADAVPIVQEPTDDQIAQYVFFLEKKEALMTKKTIMPLLVSPALPKIK